MPQIHLKQPGQPIADFSVIGSNVTVSGVTIDCAERQLDTSVIVEIRANKSGPGEGGDGAYLAQIDIPARRYVGASIDSHDDQSAVNRVPVPLNPNAIAITLWPTI